ncbi:glucan biosynthesis protein [Salipiger abyssi]|uniref:glucan biosynthesis protein n=1 Tax=Salipiger abyssi TaxID=1250539 RepID=UPI001F43181F|nr:glucan biosynthesis protein G [Salipiger abyssi]
MTFWMKSHRSALTRRALLGTLSSNALLICAASRGWAQSATGEEAAPPPQPTPFSFEALVEEMRAATANPYTPFRIEEGFLNELTYDDYRLIRFDPDRARFSDIDNTRFELQAFHMGWLFKEPVQLFEVRDGQAMPMGFDTDDFIYEREARERVPEHTPLPGVAGFRLHAPLNRPDIMDELVAFQGASYFRALGRGSAYGLSARGLAVNTGLKVAEEFPRFTRFWIERPASGADRIRVWAAMESPSLTGAYEFLIDPGKDTQMEITARLFFRQDVEQLGVAPLTSMFLYGDRNRARFDDFRPAVHDSDGLGIIRADGDRIWRSLANPPRLASSYLQEENPRAFGLYQRNRDFAHYEDAAAIYERRPSCVVEPIGDWGKGALRLVEIPSDLEVNDNIVAFWIPQTPAREGEEMTLRYKLHWGDMPPEEDGDLAYVKASRAGVGGVSGVENEDGSRKFVIDFAGGPLEHLPASAVEDLSVVTTAARGNITTQVLHYVPESKVWRLILDVVAEAEIVELSAHVAGYGQKLTETWLFQWVNA